MKYFEPQCYRTTAYHALIVEYLKFVKERGFHTAHIWSCPPAPDDDYIFNCHPSQQKIPRDNMLRAWYQELLEKAKDQGIVLRTSTLYDEYFNNEGMEALVNPKRDPTCLPYFDGDYIPGEIENIIRSLSQDEIKELFGNQNPGQHSSLGMDKIMLRLGQRLSNMRDNFIVVQLRSRRIAAAVERGENVSDWIDDDDEEAHRCKRAKLSGKDSSILFAPSKDDFHGLKIGVGSTAMTHNKDDVIRSHESNSGEHQQSSVSEAFRTDAFRRGSEGSGHFDLVDSRTAFDTEPLPSKPTGEIHRMACPAQEASNDDSFSDHPIPIDRTHSADGGFSDYGEDFGPKINEVDIQPEDINDMNDTGLSPDNAKNLAKFSFDDMEPVFARHFSSVKTSGKVVGSTVDEDEPCDTEMFESRQQFLNYCQKNHFQFDELRRAKHSTMMILFQLHNPMAPKFLQQCGACYRDITHGMKYHCNNCSSFDLCEECFEPVTSGALAQRDSRFAHDKSHTFTSIDLEAPTDASNEERARAIKTHLELLVHAASCEGPPHCSLNNCQRMKELFEHVKTCDVTVKNGCKVCSRLLSLMSMHARACTNPRGECPIPFCDRFRERNDRVRRQQQLMDDRRRQAQNDLYRVGGGGGLSAATAHIMNATGV